MKGIDLALLLLISFSSCVDRHEDNGSRVDHLPYYQDAYFTPHWLDTGSAELAEFHQVSDFKLIDQDGEVVDQDTFEDRIYVTDFFFTFCNGICPKMTENMSLVQEAFLHDDDVLLLSHSVTPQEDSVPVLKAYAENRGVVSGKWHLVTGDVSEIYRLGRESYFVEEDLGVEKSEGDFLHTENFVLVDKDRHIRGIYNGLNKTAVRQLIEDIRTLKMEE